MYRTFQRTPPPSPSLLRLMLWHLTIVTAAAAIEAAIGDADGGSDGSWWVAVGGCGW